MRLYYWEEESLSCNSGRCTNLQLLGTTSRYPPYPDELARHLPVVGVCVTLLMFFSSRCFAELTGGLRLAEPLCNIVLSKPTGYFHFDLVDSTRYFPSVAICSQGQVTKHSVSHHQQPTTIY